jgi:molybdopterin-containing oxidoreductase family iron-sulfur binding subunit
MSERRRTDPTRRQALAWAVAAGATLGRSVRPSEASADTDVGAASGPHRFGLAIDLDRCLRCQACVVACAAENNVPPAGRPAAAASRPIHWMDMLVPHGRTPALGGLRAPLPIPCLHCQEPPCVEVCPVGATYRTADGIVAQIWDRCIGCRSCMVACPYSRRYYNWTTPAWPGGDASSANPDVALRPAGVVEKCTLCQHRIRARYERARIDEEPVPDADLQRLPACAATCPAEAITFGDLADPSSAVARLAQSPRAVRLLDELGTEPKVFYLRGRR